MRTYLDFEKPVSDLEGQIQELRRLETADSVSVADEIATLEGKARDSLASIYSKLTPWQKTQVARHPDRPHAKHYISRLLTDFEPLAGDRKFGEDPAIVAGLGRFRGDPVAVLAQEKGEDTQSRLKHNFGMARPEGYRKAVRVMELADRFGLPVLSLVDTAGAYPGRRRGGARPGGGDRPLHRGLPQARRAQCRRYYRRGWLRRRDRHRHREPGLHAATRHLHRHFAGRRGLDPMARSDAGAGCGDRHEDHRHRPPEPQDHRRNRGGAARRGAPRSREGDRRARGM